MEGGVENNVLDSILALVHSKACRGVCFSIVYKYSGEPVLTFLSSWASINRN